MKAIYTSPIKWLGDRVRILDQCRLPGAEIYLELDSYELASKVAPRYGCVAISK